MLATQADGDVHIVQIRLQDSFLRQVVEETLDKDGVRMELVPAFQTRDSQIDTIASLLMTELHHESFGSHLYVDSLANVLAVHTNLHSKT